MVLAYVPIWDPLERFLLALACFLTVLVGVLYFNKARKIENRAERLTLYGYSAILILRIIFTGFTYLCKFNFSVTFINYF